MLRSEQHYLKTTSVRSIRKSIPQFDNTIKHCSRIIKELFWVHIWHQSNIINRHLPASPWSYLFIGFVQVFSTTVFSVNQQWRLYLVCLHKDGTWHIKAVIEDQQQQHYLETKRTSRPYPALLQCVLMNRGVSNLHRKLFNVPILFLPIFWQKFFYILTGLFRILSWNYYS